jgi:aspartate racemase
MKTIGIIGGMSWESTALYYKAINEGVRNRIGGFHSAKIVLASLNFHEIEALQAKGEWQAAAKILTNAGIGLKKAGADFLMIATNTMHIVADNVETGANLPLLHIADATAAKIKAQGQRKVGLLGTAFTMEKDFYKGRLETKHGIEVIRPSTNDRALVHQIIYDELCAGIIRDASRNEYLRIIDSLTSRGAEAIILGCTEIGMLVTEGDTIAPLLDTTRIHANAGVDLALTP